MTAVQQMQADLPVGSLIVLRHKKYGSEIYFILDHHYDHKTESEDCTRVLSAIGFEYDINGEFVNKQRWNKNLRYDWFMSDECIHEGFSKTIIIPKGY